MSEGLQGLKGVGKWCLSENPPRIEDAPALVLQAAWPLLASAKHHSLSFSPGLLCSWLPVCDFTEQPSQVGKDLRDWLIQAPHSTHKKTKPSDLARVLLQVRRLARTRLALELLLTFSCCLPETEPSCPEPTRAMAFCML